jgi:hypothetical protein
MPGRPEGAACRGVGAQVDGEAFSEPGLAGADHGGVAVVFMPGQDQAHLGAAAQVPPPGLALGCAGQDPDAVTVARVLHRQFIDAAGAAAVVADQSQVPAQPASGGAVQQRPQEGVGQVVGDPDTGRPIAIHGGPSTEDRPRRRACTSSTIRTTAWIMIRVLTTAVRMPAAVGDCGG